MHGTSAGVPVPLSGLGGLVTLADSESVPEGASPRTHDTDYLVQKAKTRPGLTGVYSFAGGEISKLPTEATDVATGGEAWTNPAGVEGSSSFASLIFGPASQTKIPASVISRGAGIPWANPEGATSVTPGPATITGFSIMSDVATFTAANSFAAGQPVTFSGLTAAFYFNGITLPILSASSTQFSVSFPWGNIALTADSGTAAPLATYASVALPTLPVAPDAGEYVAWSTPTIASLPEIQTETLLAECAAASFCFDSGGFIGTGINGGGPLLGHVNLHWSGFQMPALPPGAVITRIYPIITANGSGTTVSGNFLVLTSGVGIVETWSWNLPLTISGQYPNTDFHSMGSSASDITGGYIDLLLEAPAADHIYANVTNVQLAVYYTLPTAPVQQVQQLAATDSNFSVDSGAVSGVQVNFAAGMQTGIGASLSVQLTLGGNPIGTPKFLALAAWPTNYTLGSGADLWGLGSLTGTQINGSNGLGVNISATLPDGSQVNLNDLSITVSAPGSTHSDYLNATAYGFSLTTPITGLAGP